MARRPEAQLPAPPSSADRATAQALEAGERRHREYALTLHPKERAALAPWLFDPHWREAVGKLQGTLREIC